MFCMMGICLKHILCDLIKELEGTKVVAESAAVPVRDYAILD